MTACVMCGGNISGVGGACVAYSSPFVTLAVGEEQEDAAATCSVGVCTYPSQWVLFAAAIRTCSLGLMTQAPNN